LIAVFDSLAQAKLYAGDFDWQWNGDVPYVDTYEGCFEIARVEYIEVVGKLSLKDIQEIKQEARRTLLRQ
jgi:hypothetical protein